MNNGRGRKGLLVGTCSFAVAASMLATPAHALSSNTESEAGRWLPHSEFVLSPGSDESGVAAEFFVPLAADDNSLLFSNVRIGATTRSDYFTNAGVGFRSIVAPDLLLGGYAFFDITRAEQGETFYGGTLGAELLTSDFDLRANFSLPITEERFLNSQTGIGRLAIVGNELVEQFPTQRFDLESMTGVDVEAGVRLFGDADSGHEFRLFGGAYHYWSAGVANITGGRARAEYRLNDVVGAGSQLNFGAEVRDDDYRGTEITGEVRLRIPFGGTGSRRPGLSPIERRATERIRRPNTIRHRTRRTAGSFTIGVTNALTDQGFGRIFFADGANSLGAGTLSNPTTLSDAVSRADIDGIIVALGGNGDIATTGQVLADGQWLVGGGTALQVRTSDGTVQPYFLGTQPGTIANGGQTTDTITLADGNIIRNLMFTGGANAIAGSGIAGVTIDNIAIGGVRDRGIALDNAGLVSISKAMVIGGDLGAISLTGDMRASLSSLMLAGTGGTVLGIDGSSAAGTLFVTELSDVAIAGGNGETDGLVAETVVFDADPDSAGIQNVSGGDIAIGSAGLRVGGGGLILSNVSGGIEFGAVDIFTGGGDGLFIRDAGGKAGSFFFGNSSGTIFANGGAAVDIDPVVIDMTFNTLVSVGSAGHGINLDTVTGSFTVTDQTIVTGAALDGIRLVNSDALIRFEGTTNINSVGGSAIAIVNATGASAAGTATVAAASFGGGNASGTAADGETANIQAETSSGFGPSESNNRAYVGDLIGNDAGQLLTITSDDTPVAGGDASDSGEVVQSVTTAEDDTTGSGGALTQGADALGLTVVTPSEGNGLGEADLPGIQSQAAALSLSIGPVTAPSSLSEPGGAATDGMAPEEQAQANGMALIAENQPHAVGSADLIVENAPQAGGSEMIAENQPHAGSADLIVENQPHAAPASLSADNGPQPAAMHVSAPDQPEDIALPSVVALPAPIAPVSLATATSPLGAPSTAMATTLTPADATIYFADVTIANSVADAVLIDNSSAHILFDGLSIDNVGANGVAISDSSGTIGFGSASIANVVNNGVDLRDNNAHIVFGGLTITGALNHGIVAANQTGSVEFGGVTVDDVMDTALSIDGNVGPITFGDTMIVNPNSDGIAIAGSNGAIAFGNVDIVGLGSATGVDVSGAQGDITFETLDITGTAAAGSIGIDLSGSTNDGDIVTAESGDITGVEVGVDLTGASITGNFQYGDGSNTDADGAASTIDAVMPIAITGLGATGEYNFRDVELIGDTSNLIIGDDSIFYIDTTDGAGTAADPGSIAQAELSGAGIFVLVNDGSDGGLGTIDSAGTNGDETFQLTAGQDVYSFLNQTSFDVTISGSPVNLLLNGIAAGGLMTITDPTGNGAPVLTSTTGDALALGGDNAVDNVLIGDSAGDGVAIDGLSDPLVITNSMIGSVGVSGGSGDVNINGSTLGGIAIDGGSADVTLTNSAISQPFANPAVSVSGGHTGTFTTDETIATTIGSGLQFFSADGSYIFGNDIGIAGGGNLTIVGSIGTFVFNGAMSITGSTGAGIAIDSGAADVTFNGAVQIDVSGDPVANGIVLVDKGGDLSFLGGLDITTDGGIGLRAVNLFPNSGTLTVAGTGNTITTTTGQPISLNDVMLGAGGISFDTIMGGGGMAFDGVSGGAFSADTVTLNGVTGNGLAITDSPAAFSFGTVTIADPTEDAISLNGANGDVTFGTIDLDNAGARFIEIIGAANDVTFGGGTIDDGAASTGFGITIQNQAATSTISFTDVDLTRAAGNPDPLNIQNSAGTINYLGGSITGNSSNDIVDIDGGSATILISATLNESGTGNGIEIDGITGGSITFSGDYTNSGTGNAIRVGGNTALNGGTIAFTGNLSISGGANIEIGNLGTTTLDFANPLTIDAPGTNAIDITGTNGAITFSDVTITNLGAGTGIDLTGAEGDVTFASIDIAGTDTAGSIGIDLTGSTNTGDIITTNPSSITGVETGIDIANANITGMFQFGDGSDVDANGRASTIVATTPIDATGIAATGSYNFLDVDFGVGVNPGGATGVFIIPDIYYFTEGGTGDGSTAANAGDVAGAEASGAGVLIPVGVATDSINVGNSNGDTFNALELDAAQQLLGFAIGEDTLDLGFTGPANILLSATIGQATNVHADGSPALTLGPIAGAAGDEDRTVVLLGDGNTLDDIRIDNSGGEAQFGILGDTIASLMANNIAIDGAQTAFTVNDSSGIFAIDNLTITNAVHGVDLFDNNTAQFGFTGGLDITVDGPTPFDAVAFIAENSGTVSVTGTGNILNGVSGAGLVILDTAMALTFDSITGGSDSSIFVDGGTGSLTVTGTATSNGSPVDALFIANSSADYSFGGITITNGGDDGLQIENLSGSFTVTGATTIDMIAEDGIVILGSTSAISFASLAISNTGDDALQASGIEGSLTVTGTTTIDTVVEDGIDLLDSVTADIDFGAVTVTGAGRDGIRVTNVDGAIDFNGAVMLTTLDSSGVAVDDLGGTLAFADTVSIEDAAGEGVVIANSAGGTTFNGAVMIDATARGGDGVIFTANSGTLGFAAGLDIDTTTGTGIMATGGTLNILGNANTIDIADGQALVVSGTTLDATFASVNSALSGAIANIDIDNVDGSLTIGSATLSSGVGTGTNQFANIDITQNDGSATRALAVTLSGLNISHDAGVAAGGLDYGIRVQTMGDDGVTLAVSDSTFQTEDDALFLLGFNDQLVVTDLSNLTILGDAAAADPAAFGAGPFFSGVIFDGDTATAGLQSVQGGIFTAGSGAATVQNGATFADIITGRGNQGTLSFDSYSVVASDRGLSVAGDQSALTIASLGGSIEASRIDIASSAGPVTLAMILAQLDLDTSALGAPSNAFTVSNAAGSFEVLGATTIVNPETAADIGGRFVRNPVTAMAISNSSADFTFNTLDIASASAAAPSGLEFSSGGATVGIALTTNSGMFTVTGAASIEDTLEDGIRITNSGGAISFAALTITNPHAAFLPGLTSDPIEAQSAAIDIDVATTATITIGDLDIALENDGATGLELNGAIIDAAITIADFDLTSISTTDTFGIDLRGAAGSAGSGSVTIGDTTPPFASGESATIAGVDTGVIFDDAANLDFTFGDGEATDDVGSSIAAATAIDFTDDTGATGTYNFLDVTFPTVGSTANLESSIDIFYADAGLDGIDDGSAANPGQLNDAAAATADVIVLVDQNNVGTDIIDLNSATQGAIGTFILNDGQLLLSFANSDTIDLTNFGFAAGGAPANILLTGVSGGSTIVNNPNAGFGAPDLTTSAVGADVISLAAGSTTQIHGISITATAGAQHAISGDGFAGFAISDSSIAGIVHGLNFDFAGNGAASTASIVIADSVIGGAGGNGAYISADPNPDSLDITVSDTTFTSSGGTGFQVEAFDGAAVSVALANIIANSVGGTGIDISALGGGRVTISQFDTITVNDALTAIVLNRPTFDSDDSDGDFTGDTVDGGTLNVGQSGTVTGAGVTITGAQGDLAFDALNILSAGTGLDVTGSGSFNAAAGTGFRLATTTGTINSTGAAGIIFDPFTADITLASVSSGGGTNNILLDSIDGSITINGGALSGSTGNAVDINNSTLNFSYAGTIANTAGRAVEITNQSAGTITFSGAIDEDGTGIDIRNNAGSTINFTGGMDIDTGSSAFAGFQAGNGGTLNITGTNTIDTTTGQILNIQDVMIGSSGVTFANLTASGTLAAGDGIVIRNIDGGAFNGGTVSIAGTPGDGIIIANGSSATFTFGTTTIDNASGDGIEINGAGNGAVTFASVDIDGVGGAGVNISGNTGTVAINGGSIGATNDPAGIGVDINGGTADITVAASVTKTSAGDIVEVSGRTGGTVTLSGNLSAIGGVANGIDVNNNSGGASVIFSGASKVLSTGANTAVNLSNLSGSIVSFTGGGLDIDTTSGTGFRANFGGTVNVTGSGNTIATTTGQILTIGGADGVGIGASGVTFDSLTATGTTTANAIDFSNADGGVFNGGTVSIAGATGDGIFIANASSATINFGATTIDNATDDGIDIEGTGNTLFASVDIDGVSGNGVEISGNTGTVTINGGNIGATNDPAAAAVSISGGNADIAIAANLFATTAGNSIANIQSRTGGTVTLSGNLSANGIGTGLLIANNGGGAAITFSGSSKVLNSTSGGVNMTNNSGAVVSFTNGGLDIDSTVGTGFNVTGGGTINVTGAGNSVSSTTGTAVNITGSNIGASGITWQSIAKNGGSNVAINLANTGVGLFTVTGDGTTSSGGNGSGGTIENITDSDAIRLNNTGGRVTLQNMIIEDIAGSSDATAAIATRSGVDGIHGQNVNGGLTLNATTIRRISDNAVNGSLFSDSLSATIFNGLSVLNSVVENTNRFHVANRGDDGDEGGIRINGITGTVLVDNSIFRNSASAFDLFTASGVGTLDMTVQRSEFTDLYKEFSSGPSVNVGRRGITVQAEGAHNMIVRIGDPAEANAALGNVFTNNFTASVVVAGQEGGATPHTGTIQTVISRNTFRVTDHLTGPAGSPAGTFQFNFPQGGVAIAPGDSSTLEAIVSHNLFDEVMRAAGGLGQLSLALNGGDSEVIVRNNTFQLPWDATLQIVADGNNSAAVLIENNTYISGQVGGPNTDLAGAGGACPPAGDNTCPSPFQGVLVNVRNGGALDLTIRNESLPQHDVANSPTKQTLEIDVQNQAGNSLNLFLENVSAPEGFGFVRSNGAFNLFRGASSVGIGSTCTTAAPANCVTVLGDNGNSGGGGNPATNPPVIDLFGTITITGTAPTLPSIVIP